jgi:hypothetical protein
MLSDIHNTAAAGAAPGAPPFSLHLAAYIDEFFAVRTIPQVDLWAERSIYLPARVSNFEGYVDFDLTPWAREPINSLTDPEVRNEVGIYGTQLSKTTQALIVLAATIALRRQNAVWMWPSTAMGRSFSQTRWMPVVESSDALRLLKPDNADLFKNLEQHFRTGTVNFIGSHSRTEAKGRSAPVIIVDEIEDIAAATEKETDPVNAIQERTKTFTDAKHFFFGSPLLPSGPAWSHYLLGDRRHYLVPCPDCGTRQALEFRGQVWAIPPGATDLELLGKPADFRLRWDAAARLSDTTWDFDAVARSAHYSCVHCGAHLLDEHKKNMLLDGTWQPTCRATVAGYRSRRINSLYPRWGATTYGNIALKFLQSHHTAGGEQNFFNNWEARPYGRGLDLTDKAAVLARLQHIQGTHTKGERRGERTLLLADVQRTHLVWALWDYDATGQLHLRDFGYCATLDDLRDLDDRFTPTAVAIDSKYRSQEVYAAIHARRSRWIAIRGEEKGRPLQPNYAFDPFTGQANQNLFVITLLHFNSDLWGEEVLSRIYPEERPEDAGIPANDRPPRTRDLWLPADIARHPDYYLQLFSEYIEEKIMPNGKKVRRWKRSKNNHQFDLAKIALAVGSFLGLTRKGSEVSAAVAAALAAAQQPELPLTQPHGGTALYGQS